MLNDTNKRMQYVYTGFSSPSENFSESSISLDEYLIKHPAATFLAYASGDSMANAGIYDGDLLIIDRSLDAISGDIVIGVFNGKLIVRKLLIIKGQPYLSSSDKECRSILIALDAEFEIWGVVTASIKKFK